MTRRYVGDERAAVGRRMRRAYEVEGLTVAQVAARYGCSYGSAHRLLSEAGTHFRPRGVRAAR